MHRASILPPGFGWCARIRGLQQRAGSRVGVDRGVTAPVSARPGGPCIGSRPSGVAASTGRRGRSAIARLAVVDAGRLSENIDAALALGNGVERGAFLSGLQALGFGACPGATSTTTSDGD